MTLLPIIESTYSEQMPLARLRSGAFMAKKQARKKPPGRDGIPQKGLAPTDEQQHRVHYRHEAIVERGITVGRAYRRQPWFETLGARGDLDADQLRALRFYRSCAEACARSETKSCLDVRPRGSSDDGRGTPTAIVIARRNLEACERPLGILVHTVRAVALHDMRYADLAMQRFGSRDLDMIVNGHSSTKPAPKSGRHTAQIKQEFVSGMALLIDATSRLTSTA